MIRTNKPSLHGVRVVTDSVSELFSVDEKEIVDVKLLKIKSIELPESEKVFSGTIKALDYADIKFTSKDQVCGNIESSLPLNAPISSRVVDDSGNIINNPNTEFATIDSDPFRLEVEKLEYQLKASEANLKNAKMKFERYKGLYEKDSVSEEMFNNAEELYYSAIAENYDLQAQLLNAKDTLGKCSVTSAFNGVIYKIFGYPGHWSNIDYKVLGIMLTDPIGIEIDLNRALSRLARKKYPKTVYPVNSDPVGAYNEMDRLVQPRSPDWDFPEMDLEVVDFDRKILKHTALISNLDNYIIQINKVENQEEYPVIESYWKSISYVSRFYSLFDEKCSPCSSS